MTSKYKKYTSNRSVMILVSLCILFILTIISTMWIPFGRQSKISVPMWSLIASLLSIIIATIILYYIIRNILKFSKLGQQVKNDFHALSDLLEVLPELSSILDELKQNVRRGDIVPGTKQFETLMSEMSYEFKTWIGIHFQRRLNFFIKEVILRGILGVIFIFGCIYVVDYSFEMYINGTPGFCKSADVKTVKNIPEFFVEGFYYSISTFATLGYGDIHPSSSAIARIISISEVLFFILFTTAIVNIGLIIILQRSMFSPAEMIALIRYDVERVAEK